MPSSASTTSTTLSAQSGSHSSTLFQDPTGEVDGTTLVQSHESHTLSRESPPTAAVLEELEQLRVNCARLTNMNEMLHAQLAATLSAIVEQDDEIRRMQSHIRNLEHEVQRYDMELAEEQREKWTLEINGRAAIADLRTNLYFANEAWGEQTQRADAAEGRADNADQLLCLRTDQLQLARDEVDMLRDQKRILQRQLDDVRRERNALAQALEQNEVNGCMPSSHFENSIAEMEADLTEQYDGPTRVIGGLENQLEEYMRQFESAREWD